MMSRKFTLVALLILSLALVIAPAQAEDSKMVESEKNEFLRRLGMFFPSY